MIVVLITWMLFTAISVHCTVFSKVITINNSGNNSAMCCVNASNSCHCNSLGTALTSLKSNTAINITSETVLLEGSVHVEEDYLDNIAIVGHNTTVMCNNAGRIAWRTVGSIVIEGIKWDQCGDPSDVSTPGILFNNVFHISIISCTFQYFKVCRAVYLLVTNNDINITVINSTFFSNKVANAFDCSDNRASLFIQDNEGSQPKSIYLKITGSLFHGNGNTGRSKGDTSLNGALFCYFSSTVLVNSLIEHSNFSSNGIYGAYIFDMATYSSVYILNNVSVFNNINGGVEIRSIGSNLLLNILSCDFVENSNGTLVLNTNHGNLIFNEITFIRNNGSYNRQGAALYLVTNVHTQISFNCCLFVHNVATEDGESVAYLFAQTTAPSLTVSVMISSSKFIDNEGSALQVSHLMLTFDDVTLFEDNLAENGAALYTDQNAVITVNSGSLVQFINNAALLRGGAVYVDLSNCFNNGIVFNNFLNYSSLAFINNSARISGNSMYFNIPQSCDVVRDYTNKISAAYVPYRLDYIQSHSTVGPAVGATPYKINLCSAYQCNLTADNCSIGGRKMLGQFIRFNGTVCDYFNNVSETIQFQIRCNNCNRKYRVLADKLLVSRESPSEIAILADNTDDDVVDNINISLKLYSVLSDNYREFSAILSVTLSSCHNGFVFVADQQKCICYSGGDKEIVQCPDNRVAATAEIKIGYWLGVIHNEYTTVLCPINYCDFIDRAKTRSNFYVLPMTVDEQCSPHRTGAVCSECSPGYTLAYASFNCVSTQQCSAHNTVIVVVLTVVYWIVITGGLFVLTYHFSDQVSSNYFNGIIYFYSIVDILLTSNLYIKDSVFYTVAALSSFAKLTPMVLGRLCLVKGLDAIDQQFIHYLHTVCILIILTGLIIAAKCSRRIDFYVHRCITLSTVLFLQLSYTTLTSVSLQLLRGAEYSGVDGVYVYLSPHLQYFEGRHVAYATIALVCGLVLVIGLPVLLLVHPLIKRRRNRPGLLQLPLDHFQAGYREKYGWFAAYYLLCRLVIILIAYFGNSDYSSMVYYIQTACVIIVMNHICFQPYKNNALNILDTVVLLIMLLIVSLNNFNFSESATIGLVLTLILLPMLLLLTIGFKGLIMKLHNFRQTHNRHSTRR